MFQCTWLYLIHKFSPQVCHQFVNFGHFRGQLFFIWHPCKFTDILSEKFFSRDVGNKRFVFLFLLTLQERISCRSENGKGSGIKYTQTLIRCTMLQYTMIGGRGYTLSKLKPPRVHLRSNLASLLVLL